MTTDITELAQSLKAAAVRAKTATEEYASGHMSVSVCYAECEEFNRLTDGPDNILALVEALEKSEKTSEARREAIGITHKRAARERDRANAAEEALEKAQAQSSKWFEAYHKAVSIGARYEERIAELEESHAQVIQSRDHYKRISEEGLKQLAESRTVTVKLPQRLQPGADGWDDWYVHSDDEGEYLKFDDVLAMLTAAGIKVEAE